MIPAARVLGTTALIVLIGCSSSPGSTSDVRSPPGIGGGFLEAEEIQAEGPEKPALVIPPGTSAYQLELLEDGVDFSEYQQGVFENLRCLTEKGFAIDGPIFTAGGRLYSYTYAPPGFGLGTQPDQVTEQVIGAVDSVVEQCYLEYLSEVELVWGDASLPNAEESAAQQARARQCLEQAGVDVESARSSEKLIVAGLVADERVCLRGLAEFHEYPDERRGD